jgi:hypothetical protein
VEPWLLLKASCRSCAKITSAFETVVLKGLWSPVRAAFNLRSYRPKKRPTIYSVEVERDGAFERIHVPIEQYPLAMLFPRFAMPAHLGGQSYQRGINLTGTWIVHYGDPKKVARELQTRAVRYTDTFEKATFHRLLLKIAYGVAVGQCGLDGIARVYVLDAIMGRTNDIGRWLGNDGQQRLSREPFHAAGTFIVDGEIVCRVRLFPVPAPEYVIVVGRAAAPPKR